MPSADFIFKHFIIRQDKCAMKVGTDGLILGSYVKPGADAKRILDIGTGTGLLSLMLAQRSKASIDAIDIDEGAVAQAEENFRNSSWAARLKAIHSPLQSFQPGYTYDLIISNPPFFGAHESIAKAAGKERRQARSHASLSFDELISHVARLLSPDGLFYIIIPATSKTEVEALALQNALHINEQLAIRSRINTAIIRYILSISRKKTALTENELIIYASTGQYSLDYILLTRDFYAKDMLARHAKPEQDTLLYRQ
jgi:tRNA1Val (adenine37-N6)-methyltransferase